MKGKIKCPQCGNPSNLSAVNKWRPFCCERCKLIDLGDWIEGNNRIATDDPINTATVSAETPTKH